MKYFIRISFIFSFSFFYSNNYFSQNETTIWHFGLNAGLDFSTATPSIINNSAINTQEGSASISDGNGNLLFYTDGMTVYNQNHIVMPNGTGLWGNPSTTQSALIVKQPGSNTIYYIFTADAQGGPNGYKYSVVDMTLNGGLGDVSIKNVSLYAPSSEKLTGTLHCNGVDIWVITHEYNGNGFRAYLVTAAGVNPVPVVSNVGTAFVNTGIAFDCAGQMKCSPDGTKIALGMQNNGIELYDFNRTTGIVTNAINLGTSTIYSYGIEFSPDNSKLYGSGVGFGTGIKQWDVCAGNAAAIIASGISIANPAGIIGSLQLAKNGKIYVARQTLQSCGVINNPNVAGVACNYVDNGQNISPGTNVWGLPNYITSGMKQIPPPFTYTINCLSANFTAPTLPSNCINAQTALNSLSWNFGDPVSGTNNISSLNNPTHIFSSAGNYTVTLILNYFCGSDTISQTIIAGQGASAFTQNITICTGASYTLPSGNSVNTQGTYIDTILSVSGCDSIITTNLTISNVIAFTQNPVICAGQNFSLPDGSIVNLSGTYIDTLIAQGGCDSIITTNLTVNQAITFNQSISICSGSNYTLPGGNIVNSAGTYSDTLQTTAGCDSIITTILTITPASSFLQNINRCVGQTYILPGGNIVSISGTYIDTVQTITGCDSIITTTLNFVPAIISSQNINLCNGQNYTLPGGTTVTTAGIYIDTLPAIGGCDSIITTNVTVRPNSTFTQFATICSNQTYVLPSGTVVNTSGIYNDTLLSNNGCDSIITTTLIVNNSPTVNITGIFNIISGQTTTLTATGGGIYNWYPSTGLDNTNTNSVIVTTNQTTVYCVEVTDNNGCKDTTCVTVVVELPCPTNENLQMPNAFSPNGDNVNDEYCLQGWVPCVESFEIKIFDRWGEKVFESKDPNFCWDGMYKSKIMDAQVFVYYIRAKYTNIDNTLLKQGNISLIR